MTTATKTDRDRFEADETIVVWGEQCHGMAGRQARDAERIFDEGGDITPDFEQYDETDREWLMRQSGSFWWKVQAAFRDAFPV